MQLCYPELLLPSSQDLDDGLCRDRGVSLQTKTLQTAHRTTESFRMKKKISRSSPTSLCSLSISRLHLLPPRSHCRVPMSDCAIISWRVLCAASGAGAALSQPAEQRCSPARLPALSGWKGCGLGCQQCIPQSAFALSAPGVILQIMQRPHLVPAGERKPRC